MKYKLLKELPGYEVGTIIEGTFSIGTAGVGEKYMSTHPNFFEPIVEKKTYDDLKEDDQIFWIGPANGEICKGGFLGREPRSQLFLTREEAKDEFKRREWAVRKDKFMPMEGELAYYPRIEGRVEAFINNNTASAVLAINSGLAFRTREECQDAIDNHDLIRLFYNIR